MGVTSSLTRAVQVAPDRIALTFGDQQIRWRDFGDRIPRIAAGLVAHGLKPEDRVAMLGLNNARYYELFLAIPWAGGAVMPMNWRWSEDELADALADGEPTILFVDDDMLPVARSLIAKFPTITLLSFGTPGQASDLPHYDSLLDTAPMPDAGRTGHDLYGLFYTGGTTGRSKGVMLSHRNVLSGANVAHCEGYWREDATYLVAAPFFHASGTWPLIAMTVAAGKAVLLPAFDAGEVLKAIETHRATTSLLVTTMIQLLIDHPDFARTDLSSFDTVIYGAGPITAALLDRAIAAMPHVQFIQAYGMTELSPQIATLHHRFLSGEWRENGTYRAAGRACYGQQVRIVDEEDREVPRGTVGEIVARGDSVMLGYWRRPEETKQALRGGWMHTGDGGRMDENGFVYVVDRIKDMIITGGENVYSQEVENIMALHPAVHGVVVVGIPHEKWVEQVHAIVILHEGMTASEEELIAYVRERLAAYKVPRRITFRTEPFPISPANKILKRDLRAPYWAGRASSIS